MHSVRGKKKMARGTQRPLDMGLCGCSTVGIGREGSLAGTRFPSEGAHPRVNQVSACGNQQLGRMMGLLAKLPESLPSFVALGWERRRRHSLALPAEVFEMSFPLEHRFVQQAQEKLGRALPLGYVARMCRNNGGQVAVGTDNFHVFPILDSTDRKRLARTCNDIVRETASAREWPDFPTGGLAIGDNGGGDKLVILPDPDAPRYADAVYWWDHETGDLELVANAFEELQ